MVLTTWHDYINSGNIDAIAETRRNLHTGPCFTLVDNINLELPGHLDFKVHAFWGLNKDNMDNNRFPGADGSELAITVLGNEDPLTRQVADSLGLTKANLRVTRQRPGKISVFHVDINRNFYLKQYGEETKHLLPTETKKFIIFPEDQRAGEFFGFGTDSITWSAGDVFTWPWYMDHGGANSGYQYRYAIVVIGY